MRKKFFDPSTTRGSYLITVVISIVLLMLRSFESFTKDGGNIVEWIISNVIWGAVFGTLAFLLVGTAQNIAAKLEKNKRNIR